MPAKWVPSTRAFVVAASARSLVRVARAAGVDHRLHGVGERGCVQGIFRVRPVVDVVGAEQVPRAGERRDPFAASPHIPVDGGGDVVDVTVDDGHVVELVSESGELTEIAFADGTRIARDGLVVEAPLRQRSPLAEQLGATCTPGPLAADAIGVDEIHRTNSDGAGPPRTCADCGRYSRRQSR